MKQHFNAKFSIKIEKEICKLYQDGVHNGSVVLSKRFNCHWGTIINVLRKHGVRIRTNKESQTRLRLDKKHPSYKGGNISPEGYKRIYADSFGKRRLVNEHTHIMEQKIGRRLTNQEIVHHINGKKLDNRLENLELMTRKAHAIHHLHR